MYSSFVLKVVMHNTPLNYLLDRRYQEGNYRKRCAWWDIGGRARIFSWPVYVSHMMFSLGNRAWISVEVGIPLT